MEIQPSHVDRRLSVGDFNKYPATSVPKNVAVSQHGTEHDPSRRSSKSWLGIRKKSSENAKDSGERRLSRHIILPFLSSRRRSSLNVVINNKDDTGGSSQLGFKSLLIGRRRSSTTNNLRKKSLVLTNVLTEYLPYKLKGHIPDAIMKIAETELGETSSKVSAAIPALKDVIKEKKENSSWKTDEMFLLMFLRAKKFDVSKTYRLLEKFYSCKTSCYDAHPFTLQQLDGEIEHNHTVILPKRDAQGSVVVIFKCENFHPDRLSVFQFFNIGMALLVRALEDEPANQIAGVVAIIDCEKMPYAWLKHLNIAYTRCVYFMQEALPLRFKAIHILNENFIFKVCFKFCDMFISRKMKNRIHFHGKNLKSLQQHIPLTILPKKYGGLETWPKLCYEPQEIMQSNIFT